MYRVDNAVILAAGMSSRFAPLSYERPKGLAEVRGERLIERQIRQLREAGIRDVFIVTGHQAEQFDYLRGKYGATLLYNSEYRARNNHSSIYAAREVLGGSYICSADDYFTVSPFAAKEECSYYAAVYAEGETQEWCLTADAGGYIRSVRIGGRDAWYMLGQAFWDGTFTRRFLEILEEVYDREETKGKLWESIYAEHLDALPMKIRKYPQGQIMEFDTLDELRAFDPSYEDDTRSEVFRDAARRLGCRESELRAVLPLLGEDGEAAGCSFSARGRRYEYRYEGKRLAEAPAGGTA
ncbi:NTP transferase domain-containing protein [Lachnoclostridium sp. Marseille-P6806]|uniref:NTP transferase domain-containing protein n=1 Tax=Lachnoclostridium sp. Marseille-P6806 TaxID=2364793 RepID=UPI00102F456A|nr:NTP transferase domain-containing protein [Lachnoclostridium sp. Marseille-P6806]